MGQKQGFQVAFQNIFAQKISSPRFLLCLQSGQTKIKQVWKQQGKGK
jgi:hypothetical protein